jgi:hypothetical protein
MSILGAILGAVAVFMALETGGMLVIAGAVSGSLRIAASVVCQRISMCDKAFSAVYTFI